MYPLLVSYCSHHCCGPFFVALVTLVVASMFMGQTITTFTRKPSESVRAEDAKQALQLAASVAVPDEEDY